MMQVDLSQWRAAIGTFHLSSFATRQMRKFLFLSMVLTVLRFYLFCCFLIMVSVLLLPLSIIIQVRAEYTCYPYSSSLHVFARLYAYAKITLYTVLQLTKRLHLIIPAASKCLIVNRLPHVFGYPYALFVLYYMLHMQWITYRTTLLSGDIERNPGPNLSTFNFCTWNLNSITAHDFTRLSQIEAYNSIYSYDLLGIVESHLDSTVEDDNLVLDGYTFIKENHPLNVKRGGVGLYIKDSFPATNRPDIVTLSECIVCEIQLNRKKYFFATIYRSPSPSTTELVDFMENFELMLSKMAAENPYCVIITGDFNARSPQWWENDLENDAGKSLEPFIADLGLQQLISEPTHFMGDSRSCIDLILTDQPNLFIDSGVHPSLHEQCHHQIIWGKLTVDNSTLPPFKRKVWSYNKADIDSIRKSIDKFRWHETLGGIACPNLKVVKLNEVLLNIFSNFIPNKIITVRPQQSPWITQPIKNFIRKKNLAYKNFVKNGQPPDKVEGIQNMISRGSKLIEDARQKYLTNIGRTLSNPNTGRKTYWSLINKILNKAKIPIIPPLLENDILVLDFSAKAQIFNDYFVLQCTTLDTASEIPSVPQPNAPPLTDFHISDEKILKIIRSLNPNKAHGWDVISGRMIKICDWTLVVPLKLIFEACLVHGIFPETWKRANVVSVHNVGLLSP